jgi:hypothetical protein
MLKAGHRYGTVTDIVDSIRTHRKGKHHNTLENATNSKSAKIICK